MSDSRTPRTDAEKFKVRSDDGELLCNDVVEGSFARQLEIELAASQKVLRFFCELYESNGNGMPTLAIRDVYESAQSVLKGSVS